MEGGENGGKKERIGEITQEGKESETGGKHNKKSLSKG